jgi:hypothetical protein
MPELDYEELQVYNVKADVPDARVECVQTVTATDMSNLQQAAREGCSYRLQRRLT